jgi:uncharacterized phage-associated protein
MARPYDSVLVAEYMQAVANEKQFILNVTKTQKLLYILYGWFWAKHNCQILNESPRAWPYGPVFPMTREKVNFDIVDKPDNSKFDGLRGDADLVEAVRHIISTYSPYSAGQLSAWSHSPGGPWEIARTSPGFKWNDVIRDTDIKNYFSQVKL